MSSNGRRTLQIAPTIVRREEKGLYGVSRNEYVRRREKSMQNLGIRSPTVMWLFGLLCEPRGGRKLDDEFREIYMTNEKDIEEILSGERTDRRPHLLGLFDLVIHPLSLFRYYWNLTVFLFVIYTLLVTPFRLAYYWTTTVDRTITKYMAFDTFVDFFFLSDVFFNFDTGYIISLEQVIIMHRPSIIRKYLRTWFLPDLAGSLPYDLFLTAAGVMTHGVPKFLRILRMFKLMRLLRVLTMLRYAGRLEAPILQYFQGTRGRLLILISGAVICQHWANCALRWSAALAEYPDGSWIMNEMSRLPNGLPGNEQPRWVQYCWCLLKIVSIMFTCGTGALPPSPSVTYETAVLCVILTLTPVYLNAFVAGVVNKTIIDKNWTERQFSVKRDNLNDYIREKGLPLELRHRIRSMLEYRWRSEKLEPEEEILKKLPTALRGQILLHITSRILDDVPGFRDLDKPAKLTIAQRLSSEIYAPGDRIIVEKQPIEYLYLISKGRVELWIGGLEAALLEEGSYFGDVGTLLGSVSGMTVTAGAHVEVYKLHRIDLLDILEAYPSAAQDLHSMARRRRDWILEQKQLASDAVLAPLGLTWGGENGDAFDLMARNSMVPLGSGAGAAGAASMYMVPDPAQARGAGSGRLAKPSAAGSTAGGTLDSVAEDQFSMNVVQSRQVSRVMSRAGTSGAVRPGLSRVSVVRDYPALRQPSTTNSAARAAFVARPPGALSPFRDTLGNLPPSKSAGHKLGKGRFGLNKFGKTKSVKEIKLDLDRSYHGPHRPVVRFGLEEDPEAEAAGGSGGSGDRNGGAAAAAATAAGGELGDRERPSAQFKKQQSGRQSYNRRSLDAVSMFARRTEEENELDQSEGDSLKLPPPAAASAGSVTKSQDSAAAQRLTPEPSSKSRTGYKRGHGSHDTPVPAPPSAGGSPLAAKAAPVPPRPPPLEPIPIARASGAPAPGVSTGDHTIVRISGVPAAPSTPKAGPSAVPQPSPGGTFAYRKSFQGPGNSGLAIVAPDGGVQQPPPGQSPHTARHSISSNVAAPDYGTSWGPPTGPPTPMVQFADAPARVSNPSVAGRVSNPNIPPARISIPAGPARMSNPNQPGHSPPPLIIPGANGTLGGSTDDSWESSLASLRATLRAQVGGQDVPVYSPMVMRNMSSQARSTLMRRSVAARHQRGPSNADRISGAPVPIAMVPEGAPLLDASEPAAPPHITSPSNALSSDDVASTRPAAAMTTQESIKQALDASRNLSELLIPIIRARDEEGRLAHAPIGHQVAGDLLAALLSVRASRFTATTPHTGRTDSNAQSGFGPSLASVMSQALSSEDRDGDGTGAAQAPPTPAAAAPSRRRLM